MHCLCQPPPGSAGTEGRLGAEGAACLTAAEAALGASFTACGAGSGFFDGAASTNMLLLSQESQHDGDTCHNRAFESSVLWDNQQQLTQRVWYRVGDGVLCLPDDPLDLL